jgi:hypothetical protein
MPLKEKEEIDTQAESSVNLIKKLM